MSETDLQTAVIELARLFRWLSYHTYDSRRSAPGFPDCVFARRGVVIFAELKSDAGILSQSQHRWLDAVGGVVWRPADWRDGTIEKALR